jgi:hypothetical protein
LVTGLFLDPESAESAYRSLKLRGYKDDEINVIMSDDTRDKYYVRDTRTEIGTKAGEGAGVGGAVGGALGAIIGGIAAIGTNLVLPGLGLIVWGPVAAAIAGAGAGGFAGGLVGALVGWGMPEERARIYQEGIQAGGTVIGIKPRTQDDATYLTKEWAESYNGQNIYR